MENIETFDDKDVIDALLSVGAYLQQKGLRKIELTISNNSRLRIELDIDTGAVFSDRMKDTFGRENDRHL